MSEKTLITPTTAAVAEPVGFDSSALATVVVAATGLAGAEEAAVFIRAGGDWVEATDLSGNPVVLTETVTMMALVPGPIYGVAKDATAGAAGVYLNSTRRLRS
jgi:hypothetical protein